MTLDDVIKDIADTIKDSVSEAVKSVSDKYEARIVELESQLKALPVPEKGDSVTIEDVRPVLEEMVKGIELPKGEDGKSVTIEDVRPLIDEAVKAIQIPAPDIEHLEKKIDDAIAAIPFPEKGDPGIAPTSDEVAKAMEGHFAKWALDFERKADGVLEKAVDKLRQPEDGKPGRDAIELDDFDISLDGRTIKMALKRGDDVIERTLKIPALLDQGVYRETESYEKGDGVTFGGSYWIAQKDAPEGKPGSSDDFRLAVKKGRDGRESVKIERSGPVKVD
jgi:hypothetical protein